MRRASIVVSGAALLAIVMPRPAAAEKRDVVIPANDGTALKASYYPVGRPGPGVILLHMCSGATRASWDALAVRLAAAGFHVLTMDYRGFGESGGERFESLDDRGRRAAQEKWLGDIEATYGYLMEQPGVDR